MDDDLKTNPYKTLNVPKDATLTTIRSAHRKLVLSCHPDKVQDPAAKIQKAEQFHQVQQAYEILSDDYRRQRYDERVKLAELREEMMNERGPARRTADYVPRRGPSPVREMRGGRIYEERVPKNSRTFEEDVFSAKFAEFPRQSSRKFDDRYAEPTPRRTSGRVQEEKRRTREDEAERERRARDIARAAEAAAREQRTRKRDKDRKKDSEAKTKGRMAYVEDDGSDSQTDDRYYSSKRDTTTKRRHEDTRRRDREQVPRRSSKREGNEYQDDLEAKTYAAQEYITRSKEPIEIIEPRRPARGRAASNLDSRTPPAPPPEPGRRSSGRDRGRESRANSPIRSSGKKDKRYTEIVDPPTSRRPNITGASSDPRSLKSMLNPLSKKEPHRSATHQFPQEFKEFKHPGLRRSETMPISQMRRGDPTPAKSSTLKNAQTVDDASVSSDSDSEMTEEPPVYRRPSPIQKSTKYAIYEDEDGKGPSAFMHEPEEIYPRTREISPKGRRSSDRPAMAPRGSSNARTPPNRSNSYAWKEERPPRQGISRTETARAPPPLKTHPSARGSPKLPFEYSPSDEAFNVHHSTKTGYPDDLRYSKPYSRRGSEEADRDAWPGSFKNRHHRPHMERNESSVY